MKMKLTGLKSFLQFTVMLSVVGVFSIAQAAVTVANLQVNSDETKLEITTHGNCSSNNTNGCFKATGNSNFIFNLTGDKSCSAGGEWVLDAVTLGTAEGNPGNISEVAARDFDADRSTGVITPVSSNDNHILIKDDNTAVYEVWYTVTATCNGVTIDSDPRIVNDGTGMPP